jgi:hypothetical protein
MIDVAIFHQSPSRYNPQRHMSALVEDWVSRAAAMQVGGYCGLLVWGGCLT